ncbi:BTB POZ domain-containing protein [Homalodisca vitripennis]|nr:BTB POZ domain-containing protein [Homalodisca vitripennis]
MKIPPSLNTVFGSLTNNGLRFTRDKTRGHGPNLVKAGVDVQPSETEDKTRGHGPNLVKAGVDVQPSETESLEELERCLGELFLSHLIPRDNRTTIDLECRWINNTDHVLLKIATLYAERLMSDVTLVVGGVEYPAHRLILCASSEVFQVMLMSPRWSESHESRVVLQESGPCSDIFGEFLSYFYTGRIRINQHTIMPVLLLADKYNVKSAPCRPACGCTSRSELTLPPIPRPMVVLLLGLTPPAPQLDLGFRRIERDEQVRQITDSRYLGWRGEMGQRATYHRIGRKTINNVVQAIYRSEFAILTQAQPQDLTELCGQYMCDHIAHAATNNQLITWFQYALSLSHYQVAQACENFLKWNFELVARASDFVNLQQDVFVRILQQSDLVVHNEMTVYK